MDTEKLNDNVSLVIARRGWGKSTLIKNLLSSVDRFIIYDLEDEYKASEYNSTPVYNFTDLRYCIEHDEPRIIFKPKNAYIGSFEFFSCMIFLLARDYIIIIEEINRLMRSCLRLKYASDLVDRGRKRGIGLIGVCRRPFGIDKTYLSQCKNIILGFIFMPEDIQYIRAFTGDDVIAEMNELRQYEFIVYDTDEGSGERTFNTDI